MRLRRPLADGADCAQMSDAGKSGDSMLRALFAVLLMLPLASCLAAAAVGATVGAAGAVIGAGADATGAVVGAAIPGDDEDEEDD